MAVHRSYDTKELRDYWRKIDEKLGQENCLPPEAVAPPHQHRPVHPTRAAKDMLKFIGASDAEIYKQIELSGLLTDPSPFVGRKLPHGLIHFVAFSSNAVDHCTIRLFLGSEWLMDSEVLWAEPTSWRNS